MVAQACWSSHDDDNMIQTEQTTQKKCKPLNWNPHKLRNEGNWQEQYSHRFPHMPAPYMCNSTRGRDLRMAGQISEMVHSMESMFGLCRAVPTVAKCVLPLKDGKEETTTYHITFLFVWVKITFLDQICKCLTWPWSSLIVEWKGRARFSARQFDSYELKDVFQMSCRQQQHRICECLQVLGKMLESSLQTGDVVRCP